MIKIKSKKIVGAIALSFALIFCASSGTARASELTAGNVETLINASRAQAGVRSLGVSAKLTQAAQAKANDMFAKQYFAHVGPDGNGPAYWAARAGYDWIALGENIAYGYTTAESVHSAFMSSSGHRANILGTQYEHMGVAAVSGIFGGRTVVMVVEEFGATDDAEESVPVPSLEKPKYALNVASGTGDGSYTQGQAVIIKADAPASGKVFDKWTGDTAYVSNVNAATATVTMPGRAISLTATYKDYAGTFALTVNGGTGSGSYKQGQAVTVVAGAPASGKVFDKWIGDTAYVSNVNAATATVTMPGRNVTLAATYKDKAKVVYHYLTVASGSGDGWYAAGAKVRIVADAAARGKIFSKWEGGGAYVYNAGASMTYITMPNADLYLAAGYKAAAAGN